MDGTVAVTAWGDFGRLRVGYQPAASFGKWFMRTMQETIGRVDTAIDTNILSTDQFWSTQGPLAVGLWMGKAWWVWQAVEISNPLEPGQAVTIHAIGVPVAMEDFN